ncbi:MAG TPA: contractile injection system tape measure protein [Burkholderiales bacterium]|nr:contractile injection system tape measure protein [Burkholderiales bacterium]
MATSTHRVRRMAWRVKAGAEPVAFAWRAALRNDLDHRLLPAMSRAFDRIAPGDEIVRIPRLDLRLTVSSLDELAAQLAAGMERELALHRPRPRPADLEWREILVEYLATGTLRWDAAALESDEVVSRLRALLRAELSFVLRHAPPATAIRSRATFLFRLLRLLPVEAWFEVAEAMQRDRPAHVEATGRPSLREAVADIVRAGPELRAAARMAALLIAMAGEPFADAAGIVSELAAIRTLPPAQDARDIAAAAAGLPAVVAAFLVAHGEATAPARTHARSNVASGNSAPTLLPGRALEASGRHAETSSAQPAGWTTVAQAGLVLLHPFLPSLFGHCGFVEAGRLVSADRACALLHWLAIGVDGAQEFELGFVKLLLGLRPEQPLAVEPGLLAQAHREEGEAVLRAVLSHWKALGGTSIDGLRVSFLQRRGYLREEDDGWKLQMESEAFDVLIARLPWGIGTTRLPWMTRALFTDWPTP